MLEDGVDVPLYQTVGSVAFDLANKRDITLYANSEPLLVETGVYVEIPKGYVILLSVRSSIGRQGIIMPNSPGIIDQDYRGEIKLPLYKLDINRSNNLSEFKAGTRLAQAILLPVTIAQFQQVDRLSKTNRGDGGFGSTN